MNDFNFKRKEGKRPWYLKLDEDPPQVFNQKIAEFLFLPGFAW